MQLHVYNSPAKVESGLHVIHINYMQTKQLHVHYSPVKVQR